MKRLSPWVVLIAAVPWACSEPVTKSPGKSPTATAATNTVAPAAATTNSRPEADSATAALLTEVTALHKVGRYDEGLILLQAEITEDPDRPRLHYNLGVFQASMGNYEAAVAAFEEELARYPGHVDSHRALAIALTRVGRLDDTVVHFGHCLETRPDDPLCRFELGRNLSTLGLFKDARPHLEQAAELRRDATGYAELAVLYRRLDKPKQASLAFSRALADNPNHLPTLLGYGQILTAVGRQDDGEMLLERHRHLSSLQDQLEIFERSREQSEPQAEDWADLGRLHRQRDDRPAAKAAYEQALQHDDTHAVAAVELSALYLEDGQLAEAERSLELALTADPNNPAPSFFLGLLRLKQGQSDDAAAEALKRSLELGSWPAQAYLDLGDVYLETGELNGAATTYLEALRLEPQNPKVHLQLAKASYQAGQSDSAAKAAQRAVELDPGLDEAWTLLGVLQFEAGEMQQAEQAFRRALDVERQALLRADAEDQLLDRFPDSVESQELFRRLVRELTSGDS